MITIEMHGIKDLQAQMAGLPLKLQQKAMKVGTKEGAMIVKQEARALAPKSKGDFRKSRKVKRHLRDLIGYSVGRKHFLARSMGIMKFRGDTVTHIVGLKKGGMHGVPVHFGHRVVSRRSSKMQGPSGYRSNKNRFRSRGMVTGYVPPTFFMSKAMERSAARITRIMNHKIQQAISAGIFTKGRAFRQK